MSRGGYNPNDDLNDDAPDLTAPTGLGREKAARAGDDADAEYLTGRPEFVRWLLTFTKKARISEQEHLTHETSLAAQAGRRALALEVLDDLRRVDPSVLIKLEVEKARSNGVRT